MIFLCAEMPISTGKMLAGVAIMAAITYLCRMLTLVLVRKKIRNRFVRSVLTYIPFGVLAAMVFPEIFYSTAQGGALSVSVLVATIAGTVVAIALALFRRGLFTVSMSATATVCLMILILQACGVA